MDEYNSIEGLLAPVRDGALRPLSGRYIMKLAAGGGQLRRRQDLPEEAFYLPANSEVEDVNEGFRKYHFIALSYRWLSQGHPDPEGFHLGILSAVLKVHTEYYTFLPDVGMFWDFGSLFQNPRVDNQEELFKMGLTASNIWYGSSQSTVWLQPHLPLGFVGGGYEQSGWCFVEASISSVIKTDSCRLDLKKLAIDDRGTIHFDGDVSDMVRQCKSGRMPPLTPDVVAKKLEEEMVFTNDSDVGKVAALYKRFFDAASSMARDLTFIGCSWTAHEMRGFAQALPLFTQLETLNLSDNNLSDEGVELVAKSLAANTTLKFLNLTSNHVGNEGAAALAEAVKANTTLTVLSLTNNEVADAGATALAEALEANTTLEFLVLEINKVENEGAAALAKAVKANGKVHVSMRSNPGREVFFRKLAGPACCCFLM